MDKLCIIITGISNAGKTFLGNNLSQKLKDKHIVDYMDLLTYGIRDQKTIEEKINEYFDKTGVSILILETHPPFIFNLKNEKFETLYIHLKIDYEKWIKTDPSKKSCGFFLGNMLYRDFITKCINNKNYYNGANDIYGAICTRMRDETGVITIDDTDEALNYILDFIDKKIVSTLEERKKKFNEFAKRKIEYLNPDYTVFQYQSFDYGNDISNIGMSDPKYKWDRILKMGKIGLWKKSVLDIGCNIGEIIYLAALRGANAYGLEHDQNFYEAAKFLQQFRKRPIEFFQADFMKHDFKDCKYDVVFGLAVLYLFFAHYPIEEVIKKIRSITKEVFIGELTYNDTNKDKILKALKDNFSKVEFIGDSFRTDTKRKECWNTRTDLSSSRQVWHCYI